jgi:beta-glucosidase
VRAFLRGRSGEAIGRGYPQAVTELAFPASFLWGAATAAHQVEGGNANSDWWDWERRPGTPCRDRSDIACDTYNRYPEDVRTAAELGLNTFRYSVEWARVEPEEGRFDGRELDHYRRVTDAVLEAGLTPMVTLHHFSLPRWVAATGGWMDPATPARLARYCDTVVRALGNRVDWYCTINEPGVVAFGGYLGALDFPPGRRDAASWERATDGLVAGQRLALAAVREARPSARAGATHSMQEWQADEGGRPIMEYIRRRNEDVFLEASAEDDFVGVQTYTRVQVRLGGATSALLGLALRSDRAMRILAPRFIRGGAKDPAGGAPPGARRTRMGYEFRPEAVAATVRRAAELLPGKDILVTEHGVATDDDAERVEFIDRGLHAIHAEIDTGLPVRGYIHWSLLDNFEWAKGYEMRFGLVDVDRATLTRTVRPSGRFLGDIARTGRIAASPGAR